MITFKYTPTLGPVRHKLTSLVERLAAARRRQVGRFPRYTEHCTRE